MIMPRRSTTMRDLQLRPREPGQELRRVLRAPHRRCG